MMLRDDCSGILHIEWPKQQETSKLFGKMAGTA